MANPPYLDESEVREAQPEVRDYDPPSALSSPDGGLRDLREILSEAREHLLDGGFIACECGLGQPQILAREAVEKFGFFGSPRPPRPLQARKIFNLQKIT